MSVEPLITLRAVTKRYEQTARPALDAIDLEIEPGRITADHGAVGLRQVDAAQPRRWPRTARRRRGRRRRRPRRPAERDRRGAVPAREGRLRLPVLPSARRPHGPGQRRRRRSAGGPIAGRCRRADGRAPRPARPRRSGAPFPGDPERRRTPAAGHRAGDRQPAGRAARRRTDRGARPHNGETALALLEDLNRHGQTILLVTHDEQLAQQRAHRIVRLVDGAIVDRPARPGWWHDGRRPHQGRRRPATTAPPDRRSSGPSCSWRRPPRRWP